MDFEKTLLNCTPVYPEAKNKIHMLSAFGEGKQRNHGIGIRSTATRKRPGDATIAINGGLHCAIRGTSQPQCIITLLSGEIFPILTQFRRSWHAL